MAGCGRGIRGSGVRRAVQSIAAVAVGLAPALARAQDVLDEASLEELMGIPLSAPAKVAQPVREAPSVGSVVTSEQIDSYGWLTLNDVLFRQPGFAPAQDYERVTVAARGLFEGWNNNHLLMLVDGVPFNNATNGFAYTWDVFPLIIADNVEMIRGPGSALYGTSATNGVVAVHTRAPDNERPLDARVRIGNAGTQIYEVHGGYRLSPVDVMAAYSYQRTGGNEYLSLDGSGRVDAAGAPQYFEVNDKHSSHYLFGKLAARGALTRAVGAGARAGVEVPDRTRLVVGDPRRAGTGEQQRSAGVDQVSPAGLAGRPAGTGAGGAGPAPPKGLPDQVPAERGAVDAGRDHRDLSGRGDRGRRHRRQRPVRPGPGPVPSLAGRDPAGRRGKHTGRMGQRPESHRQRRPQQRRHLPAVSKRAVPAPP